MSARGHAPAIALIGAGRMGAIHGRNAALSSRLDLRFLVETRSEAGSVLADELGCRQVRLEDVLADPQVKGVIVASSADAHLKQVLACVRAGKAVFCEKPLDLDLGRLRTHAEELGARPSPLFVAFNRRFDPEFQALRRAIADDAVGRLETLHIISHDPAPPPADFIPRSGGLFRDFTIHDFDTARWLLEEEPQDVFAWASCLVDPAIARAGDVDTARILLRTASGRMCMISNSRRSAYGYDQRIEAYGSGGMIRAGNPPVSSVSVWSAEGAVDAGIHSAFPARYAQAYRGEMDHFADMLEGRAVPITGYHDAVRALALAEAAERSSRLGSVVALSDV